MVGACAAAVGEKEANVVDDVAVGACAVAVTEEEANNEQRAGIVHCHEKVSSSMERPECCCTYVGWTTSFITVIVEHPRRDLMFDRLQTLRGNTAGSRLELGMRHNVNIAQDEQAAARAHNALVKTQLHDQAV